HPGLRLTIDHLGGRGGTSTLKDAAAMTHIPELLSLAKFPNVAVKATGVPHYSGEAYPFPALHPYLRQVYEAFGPHRMFWGTGITRKEPFPMKTNMKSKQVAVVIGATSKWQSDGRNTILAHGHPVDDSDVEVGVRWGVGGAIAQKFAQEGFFTVVTTRSEANAAPLPQTIRE